MPKVEVGEGGPSQAGWHQIEDFLACPKRFQLKHIRGIRQPAAVQKPAFAVGSMVHAGRGEWLASQCDTRQPAIDKVVDAVQKAAKSDKLPATADAERQALNLVMAYIEHWSGRPAPVTHQVEYLLGPAPLQAGDPLWLCRTAKLDDVSQYPESMRELAIGECKTTSMSVAACVQQYTLHGQTMLQQWLWKVAAQGEKKMGRVRGTVLDIIVKGWDSKKPVFAREFIPFSEYQFEWFTKSLRGYLKAAVMIDYNSEVPRNVASCTKSYGEGKREIHFPCEFRDLCKWGKAKAVSYVDADGVQLSNVKPTKEHTVPPWD